MANNFTSNKGTNEKRWTDISGVMNLYTNEVGNRLLLSTSISRKVDENEYTNLYCNVSLPRGTEPQEKGKYKINVKKGFISCYADKNGDVKMRIIVQEFDVI